MLATEKYDGTNVGKDEHGLLYGRRLMIPSGEGRSYQHTPLTAVNRVDTARMKADLFAELDATPEEISAFTMVVYGELMINKGLFDYAERSLSSGWFAFGAILRHNGTVFNTANAEAGVTRLAAQLTKHGYACTSDSDSDEAHLQVKLTLSEKFQKLVEGSGGGTTPDVRAEGPRNASMSDVVERMRPWMLECKGEGVVLTIPKTVAGKPNAIVRKWKTAIEPQGSNADVLRATLSKVQALKGACVDEKIVGMLLTLLAVTTATPPEGSIPAKKKKKDKVPMKAALDSELVHAV